MNTTWIKTSTRLPTEDDADCDGRIWIWAQTYVQNPEARADREEDDGIPQFIEGPWRAWREPYSNIRNQKAVYWAPTNLVRPAPPEKETT